MKKKLIDSDYEVEDYKMYESGLEEAFNKYDTYKIYFSNVNGDIQKKSRNGLFESHPRIKNCWYTLNHTRKTITIYV